MPKQMVLNLAPPHPHGRAGSPPGSWPGFSPVSCLGEPPPAPTLTHTCCPGEGEKDGQEGPSRVDWSGACLRTYAQGRLGLLCMGALELRWPWAVVPDQGAQALNLPISLTCWRTVPGGA